VVEGGFFGGVVAIGVAVGVAIGDGGVVGVGHLGLENEDVFLGLLGSGVAVVVGVGILVTAEMISGLFLWCQCFTRGEAQVREDSLKPREQVSQRVHCRLVAKDASRVVAQQRAR